MKTGFRKISRVRSLIGGTRWFLDDNCLLAEKRTMYVVEYRRFYLRDLQCIIVWPSRYWLWRLILPEILLVALAASLWHWVNSTSGEIVLGIALAWALLELILGPTAQARIRATGVTVDIPLVKRTRRAAKVLGKIDAAVRASRAVTTQSSVPMPGLQSAVAPVPTMSEASASTSIADAPQTNGF